jgi:hypothetical protein
VAAALVSRGEPAAGRDRTLALSLHRDCPVRTTVLVIGMVVAHIGCYQPTLRDCTIRCHSPGDCAGDQICLAEGYCAGRNVARCTEDGEPVIIDAAPDAPVSTVDARDLCSQGCPNGTCIDGVCTIDCSLPNVCSTDVVCPANLPCHVICGDSSCDHKVNCTLALSCTVDCIGTGACGDEIQCSSHECNVTCSGPSSCKRRTRCAGSCACDVSCTGTDSCVEASECPSSTCRVGNGCSSIPTGCDDCP